MRIYKEDTSMMTVLYPEFYPHFERRIRDSSLRKLKVGDVVCLVVAETVLKEPVGFSCTLFNEGEEVGVTVVKNNYRGQGIGTKLLKERYKFRPNVLTKVWEKNIASRKMCEASGLKKVSIGRFFTETTKEGRVIITYGRRINYEKLEEEII